MVPRVKGSSVVSASTWVAAVGGVPSLLLGTSTCPEPPPPPKSRMTRPYSRVHGGTALSQAAWVWEKSFVGSKRP